MDFSFLTNRKLAEPKVELVALTRVPGGASIGPPEGFSGCCRNPTSKACLGLPLGDTVHHRRVHTTPRSVEEGRLEEGPYLFAYTTRQIKDTEVKCELISHLACAEGFPLAQTIAEEVAAKRKQSTSI